MPPNPDMIANGISLGNLLTILSIAIGLVVAWRRSISVDAVRSKATEDHSKRLEEITGALEKMGKALEHVAVLQSEMANNNDRQNSQDKRMDAIEGRIQGLENWARTAAKP